MSVIADKIEKFILNKLTEEQERLILKRNELADELDCAPSQISYVLSTVFLMNEDLMLNLDED